MYRKSVLLACGAPLILVSTMLANEASVGSAFVMPSSSLNRGLMVLGAEETNNETKDDGIVVARRSVLQSSAAAFVFAATTLTSPFPSHALVKGNAPPPKSSPPGSSSEKKCRNVEECQEQAERLAQQKLEEEMANATPPKVAPGGSRYKDIVEVAGTEGEEGSSSTIRVAKAGDTVELRYKVLKLGRGPTTDCLAKAPWSSLEVSYMATWGIIHSRRDECPKSHLISSRKYMRLFSFLHSRIWSRGR